MTEGLENTGSKGGRSQDSSLPLLITDEIGGGSVHRARGLKKLYNL